MKYYILPFGCQMNLSDTERIRAVLDAAGMEATENEEHADILGIVSCSVRQKAIDKVYSRIHRWNKWKDSRQILTFVSGCILPADREKFLDRFDIVLAIEEMHELPDMIRQNGITTPLSATNSHLPDIRDEFWQVEPAYSSQFEAFVPIQNGCDKFCTFCAVPYTRGREVSRPSEEIVAEVQNLADRGYRSITLLGQNVNSYGHDRRSEEISFAQLLGRVGKATKGHDLWVYFTSPHPHDMTDDVLECIAEYPTLANQIHLPIQSGDDEILKRMNRNYRLADYRKIVQSIRRILPLATLFTDVIVGFSGETEEQFEKTRAALNEFAFAMAYIAMYSPRPGAVSSKWGDDVAQSEKKRRYHELSKSLVAGAHKTTGKMVGSTVRALVTGTDRKPGYLTGHTEGRIPVRLVQRDDVLPGRFVDVRVTAARPLSVSGEVE